jgi:hypothetical protein
MKLGLQKVAEMNTFEYNKSKEIEWQFFGVYDGIIKKRRKEERREERRKEKEREERERRERGEKSVKRAKAVKRASKNDLHCNLKGYPQHFLAHSIADSIEISQVRDRECDII